MRKVLSYIICMTFIGLAHADGSGPEDVYFMFLSELKETNNIQALYKYMSDDAKSRTNEDIDGMVKRGRNANEAKEVMLRMMQATQSCVVNRKKQEEINKGSGEIIIVYKFEDRCLANTFRGELEKHKNIKVADTEKVYMVNEDGWKISKAVSEISE